MHKITTALPEKFSPAASETFYAMRPIQQNNSKTKNLATVAVELGNISEFRIHYIYVFTRDSRAYNKLLKDLVRMYSNKPVDLFLVIRPVCS